MNIIRMTGGLGNQMFQYALYLKYKSLGIDAVFDDFTEYDPSKGNRRPIALDVFGIDYPKASIEQYYDFTDSYPGLMAKIKRKLKGRHNREYFETPHAFDPAILTKDNAYISGFFQSEKYFSDIKEDVLRAFTFTAECEGYAEDILEDNDILLSDISSENSISIHIRRGDYLAVSEVFGGICTDEYYDNAVRMINDRVKAPAFYIFTNDVEYARDWAKSYTERGVKMKIVTGTTEATGYLDMYLMSLCHHHIIANSSFSWWGAYLNKKEDSIVIAPNRWVNNLDDQDIYTEDMIKL